MIKKIYSVYDKVAGEHSDLFLAKNIGIAERMFNSNFGKLPNSSEYQLVFHGDFDTETGFIIDGDLKFKPVPVNLLKVTGEENNE